MGIAYSCTFECLQYTAKIEATLNYPCIICTVFVEITWDLDLNLNILLSPFHWTQIGDLHLHSEMTLKII